MPHKAVIAIASLILMFGCDSSTKSLGSVVKFTGHAALGSGEPIRNAIVILQPIEQGYEIELEIDDSGLFEGEGLPGRYVYYFVDSKQQKTSLPKSFPIEYRDPRKEHVITLEANQHIVCVVK